MEKQIQGLSSEFDKELSNVKKVQDLENLRIKFLGKKGPITSLMQSLKDVPREQKPLIGKLINDLKVYISTTIDQNLETLSQKELEASLKEESIDITLPGKKTSIGRVHPISKMLEDVLKILSDMGFSIQYSPEIESEYYNYGGLNYPDDHPARDMQDTYYITKDVLLRSHTTNIQQRIMEKHKPPIRVAAPGKCYRNETISTRSHVLFHQIDVFYVDTHVTFADLLATKKEFYSRIFEKDVEIRVRPSYFPFVEPGMEVDIRCTRCNGDGCTLCKHSGWLEVCGAGMVHPNVLKEGGLDPDVYSGYAWGGGIERLSLLKYGINDIRLFMENDMRFLSQYS